MEWEGLGGNKMKKIPSLVAIINHYIDNEETSQDITYDIKQAGFINKAELSNYGYVRLSEVCTAINQTRSIAGMVYVKDLLDALTTHKYSEDKK